jgi:acyl-CoA thioesterase I
MRRSKQLSVCQLTVFVVFIFWAISLSGCAKQEIKNAGSTGATVICFGDSLTFGYGVSSGEDYPSRLSEMLNMPVVNSGIDGDSSVEALKRIQTDVLERSPLIVIIEFGGNDFLRKVPIEDTVNNIRQMTDMVQAKGAMVAIVDISSGMFFADYSRAFKKIACEKQAILIPSVLNGIITNPQMKSDFLHPNSEGYRIIAQRVYKGIAPYIKTNSTTSADAAKN